MNHHLYLQPPWRAWARALLAVSVCIVALARAASSRAAEPDLALLAAEARATMQRATEFYRSKVALRGGYVYYYSLDLGTRWGEGRASNTQVWVQPPGTPTVGAAFLDAFAATGDQTYLDAADEAAAALLFGQMQSGGWEHSIDFDPRGKTSGNYRGGRGQGKNYSTLDDDCTQAALHFLMRCDQAHNFKHEKIHEAVLYAIEHLVQAQFPNGAFPQVWDKPAASQPVIPASFPDYDWRTEHRIKEYWNLYTLNDDLAGDMARTLLAGWEIYQDQRCSQALRKLGDFLILAQLPDPQPAWAQQYDYAMRPCWARKFEPPAVTGQESQDAISTLMLVYRHTGDAKYLAPIPKALAYLERCTLADGTIARFYELQTNKPLYMTKKYELTYSDDDLPTHYGFQQRHRLPKLREEYELLVAGKWQAPQPKSAKTLAKSVRGVIDELDAQGRWVSTVEGGRLTGQPKFGDVREYLSSEVFSYNLSKLSAFVNAYAASSGPQKK